MNGALVQLEGEKISRGNKTQLFPSSTALCIDKTINADDQKISEICQAEMREQQDGSPSHLARISHTRCSLTH